MNGDCLHQLRLNMLTDDMLFNDFLQISDRNAKWQFITQKIWILHENYIQQLKDQFRQSIHFNQENSHTSCAETIFKIGVVIIFAFIVIKIIM